MPKPPLTAAESAAYTELARAAAKLRRAQEAAKRKRMKLQTAAELEQEQTANAGRHPQGMTDDE